MTPRGARRGLTQQATVEPDAQPELCFHTGPRLEGGTRDGGVAVRGPRRRWWVVRCLVVPAPVPAVPPVPVPVSVVMATPVVAVVVVISVMPVAVCAGHAAGEDLRYLHVVSSLGGETGFLRPHGRYRSSFSKGYQQVVDK